MKYSIPIILISDQAKFRGKASLGVKSIPI